MLTRISVGLAGRSPGPCDNGTRQRPRQRRRQTFETMTATTDDSDDHDARPTVGMGADSTDIDHLIDFDAWRAAAWATTDTLDRLTPGEDR